MPTTLPGVRVTLSDSYYSANDVNPNLERVLIIAKAGAASPVLTDGLHTPVQYLSEAAVAAACGIGSEAHVAYVQALRSGASNIYVSATDPANTTVAQKQTELVTALSYADAVEPDMIVPFGYYANEIVPGVATETVTLNIKRVDSDTDTDDVTFSLDNTTSANWAKILEGDTVTVADLLDTVAGLNGNHVIISKLGTYNNNPRIVVAKADVADLSVDTSAYNPRATAVKTIASANPTLASFAVELGKACHRLMRDLNPCIGVISLVPISPAGDAPTAAEINDYVTAIVAGEAADLTGLDFAPIENVISAIKSVTVDSDSNVDLGKYLVPVVGDIIVRGQPVATTDPWQAVFTSSEAVVAGQIYSTPLEDAITVSPLTNVVNLRNNFSRAQKLSLVGKHVNPVCLSSSSTIVTYDGWTMAQPDATTGAASVYERLSTVRIVNEIIKATRNELEKFIGMQASTARLNSIETKLRTIYTAFKSAGVLRNAEFKITYSQGSGTLTVDLNLVPFGEIREVAVTVSVRINA